MFKSSKIKYNANDHKYTVVKRYAVCEITPKSDLKILQTCGVLKGDIEKFYQLIFNEIWKFKEKPKQFYPIAKLVKTEVFPFQVQTIDDKMEYCWCYRDTLDKNIKIIIVISNYFVIHFKGLLQSFMFAELPYIRETMNTYLHLNFNPEMGELTDQAKQLKDSRYLISIIRQFTVDLFIEIVVSILLEERLLFYGQKSELAPAIYSFMKLIEPFKWQFDCIAMLPFGASRRLTNRDKKPAIYGCERQVFREMKHHEGIEHSSLIEIDLDSIDRIETKYKLDGEEFDDLRNKLDFIIDDENQGSIYCTDEDVFDAFKIFYQNLLGDFNAMEYYQKNQHLFDKPKIKEEERSLFGSMFNSRKASKKEELQSTVLSPRVFQSSDQLDTSTSQTTESSEIGEKEETFVDIFMKKAMFKKYVEDEVKMNSMKKSVFSGAVDRIYETDLQRSMRKQKRMEQQHKEDVKVELSMQNFDEETVELVGLKQMKSNRFANARNEALKRSITSSLNEFNPMLQQNDDETLVKMIERLESQSFGSNGLRDVKEIHQIIENNENVENSEESKEVTEDVESVSEISEKEVEESNEQTIEKEEEQKEEIQSIENDKNDEVVEEKKEEVVDENNKEESEKKEEETKPIEEVKEEKEIQKDNDNKEELKQQSSLMRSNIKIPKMKFQMKSKLSTSEDISSETTDYVEEYHKDEESQQNEKSNGKVTPILPKSIITPPDATHKREYIKQSIQQSSQQKLRMRKSISNASLPPPEDLVKRRREGSYYSIRINESEKPEKVKRRLTIRKITETEKKETNEEWESFKQVTTVIREKTRLNQQMKRNSTLGQVLEEVSETKTLKKEFIETLKKDIQEMKEKEEQMINEEKKNEIIENVEEVKVEEQIEEKKDEVIETVEQPNELVEKKDEIIETVEEKKDDVEEVEKEVIETENIETIEEKKEEPIEIIEESKETNIKNEIIEEIKETIEEQPIEEKKEEEQMKVNNQTEEESTEKTSNESVEHIDEEIKERTSNKQNETVETNEIIEEEKETEEIVKEEEKEVKQKKEEKKEQNNPKKTLISKCYRCCCCCWKKIVEARKDDE